MHPLTRFRPGFLVVLGLAAFTACGRNEPAPAAATPHPGAPGAPVSIVSATAAGRVPAPTVVVQADALVTAGTSGHVAVAGGDPGLAYKWFVDNGKIEGTAEGSSILWTAGEAGSTRVYCAGAADTGGKTVAMATVRVVPPPAISRFDAKPPAVNPGETAALGWDAADAVKLVLDPGGEDVTALKGPGKAVQPKETTLYTLTATNEAGTAVSKAFTVKVVPPPVVKSFAATGAIAADHPLTLVGEFSGGKAEIRKGAEVLAASTQSPIQTTTTLKNGDSFTLVVTCETGSTATSTRTFSVQGH